MNPAAHEIGLLVNHILALAPDAGLYVSIKIEPRNDPTRQITHADCAEMAGGGVGTVHAHSATTYEVRNND